jgi:hypothetical protein
VAIEQHFIHIHATQELNMKIKTKVRAGGCRTGGGGTVKSV